MGWAPKNNADVVVQSACCVRCFKTDSVAHLVLRTLNSVRSSLTHETLRVSLCQKLELAETVGRRHSGRSAKRTDLLGGRAPDVCLQSEPLISDRSLSVSSDSPSKPVLRTPYPSSGRPTGTRSTLQWLQGDCWVQVWRPSHSGP